MNSQISRDRQDYTKQHSNTMSREGFAEQYSTVPNRYKQNDKPPISGGYGQVQRKSTDENRKGGAKVSVEEKSRRCDNDAHGTRPVQNYSWSRKVSDESSVFDDSKSAFLIFSSKVSAGSNPDLKSERRIVNNPYLDKLGQEEKYQEQQEFVGLGSLKAPVITSWGRQ